MKAVIVSDLHIGSPYFLNEEFEDFLTNISQDHDLILNGDIVDNPYEKLIPSHQRILDLIEQISYHRKVVWIRGNHDNGTMPGMFGQIHFKRLYNLGDRLLIAHGDYFDKVMPRNRAFMKACEWVHDLRVKLGANPVHVAQYVKKWKFFYRLLRNNVMINAVNWAMENGYDTVICGHTHYPEDRVFKGVRYINTGSWTESPASYLELTDGKIILKTIPLTPNPGENIQSGK